MPPRRPSPLVWVAILVPLSLAVIGTYVLFFGSLGRRPTQQAAATGAREEDGPFVYARPKRRRMPPPERFAAPLPASIDEIRSYHDDDQRFPPTGHVTARLCAGDEEMLSRFHAALEQAVRMEGLRRADLITWYAEFFDECDAERPCDRLRARALDTSLSGPVREVYWLALARCEHEPAATFERDDASPLALFDWHRGIDPEGRPPHWPPLGRAIVQLAADETLPPHLLRSAAYELLRSRDPAAEEALVRADAAAVTPEHRVALGLGAFGARTEKGRALHRRACRAEPDDAACRDRDREDGEGDDGARPLAKAPPPTPDPAISAARTRLTELGLLDGPRGPDPSAEDGLPAACYELIETARRGIWFDVETGTFPNHHDEVLARIAVLARPALDGVLFEEVPPEDPEDEDAAYTLRAYADGFRYELSAENLGDWYDMKAVLGLANALLRDRKSGLGCLTLGTGDQTTKVVCGPRAGLRTAGAEGLLQVDGADEPARTGKELEDEVLRELRNQ